MLTFYGLLLLAGSQDILAAQMNVTIQPVTWALRISLVTLPFIVAAVSFKLFRDLRDSPDQPEMLEEPVAPNEVEATAAPSPVGAAPELLGPTKISAEPAGSGDRLVTATGATLVAAVAGYALVRGLRRLLSGRRSERSTTRR